MKPIRKRISRPYLLIIILIPLSIILFFNLIVSFYSKNRAEEDLLKAVYEISRSLDSGNSQNLISIIRNQDHTSTAEIIAFSKNGTPSKLLELRESFITDEIAHLAYEKLDELNDDEIGSFSYDNNKYYVVNVDYNGNTMMDKIAYISKGLVIDDFVIAVNMVLIIVSIIITAIALFVSSRVTNAVAKPIERLTSLVEGMKTDEIVLIENTSDSLEIRRLTEEINALNRRIYHYDKAQKNFLHNASHELRTPLMSIQGYADGIEMGIFQDFKGTAHLISEQSQRLTSLVDGLLKLARAENFSTNKKLEKLNLSESVENIINGYMGYASKENVEIKTFITNNIFVNSNAELLQGSVGNIISNAIRYAKSDVLISLEILNKKAVIKIKDDGSGIENIDNIFERFSKGEEGNFGLGLSIAKTSIDMMNGEIKVYNQNGAVFEIILAAI